MSRNTSISLGNYFDEFVQGRISAGRFNNASEVVRAALRLLEDQDLEREVKIETIREALRKGEASGQSRELTPGVMAEIRQMEFYRTFYF